MENNRDAQLQESSMKWFAIKRELSSKATSQLTTLCSTRGRLTTTFGKEDPKTQYCGSAIFVDHASGYLFVAKQVHLNTHETMESKAKFE